MRGLRTPDACDGRRWPRGPRATSRICREAAASLTKSHARHCPSSEDNASSVNVTEAHCPTTSVPLARMTLVRPPVAQCPHGAGLVRGDSRAHHARALFPWKQQPSRAFDSVFKNTGAAMSRLRLFSPRVFALNT